MAPTTGTSPEPIRVQIIEQSGFSNIDQVIADAPESTAVSGDVPRGPNGRTLRKDGTERAAKRRRSPVAQDPSDLMSDPQYRKAIAGMNFYGAPRIIKRSFKTIATLTHDDTLDLDAEENEAIDNYFYAVSKHTSFDPMASLLGRILLLVLLLGEIVVTRILVRSALGRELKKLITGEEPKDEPETAAVQDNGSVRPGSIGEDFPT
jgi:hypothetical protein